MRQSQAAVEVMVQRDAGSALPARESRGHLPDPARHRSRVLASVYQQRHIPIAITAPPEGSSPAPTTPGRPSIPPRTLAAVRQERCRGPGHRASSTRRLLRCLPRPECGTSHTEPLGLPAAGSTQTGCRGTRRCLASAAGRRQETSPAPVPAPAPSARVTARTWTPPAIRCTNAATLPSGETLGKTRPGGSEKL